jgi:(2Fe-2S) ferredoxin
LKPADIIHLAEKELDTARSYKYRINVCCSSGCLPFGALKLLKAFEDAVKEFGVQKDCKVARTGCIGTCSVAPVVMVEPGDYLYQAVTPEKAREIVRDHIVLGLPIKNLLYSSENYFTKQHRLVLKNAGKIDPLRIEDYIAAGGYSALVKSLLRLSPKEVIDEVYLSGLR